jgi:hypothetical protein
MFGRRTTEGRLARDQRKLKGLNRDRLIVVEKKSILLQKIARNRKETQACKIISTCPSPLTCGKITIEEAEARVALQRLHRALSPSHNAAESAIPIPPRTKSRSAD